MRIEGLEEHPNSPFFAKDEDLRVPRDIFRSRLLYEVIRHRNILIAIGLELLLYAYLIHVANKDKNADIRDVIIIAASVFGLMACFLICLAFKSINGGMKNAVYKLHFLREVAMVKPGIQLEKWDVIAARMNAFLHHNNSFFTPYYYYNGESCFYFFRGNYLLPYLKEKHDSKSNIDEEHVYDFVPFYHQVLDMHEESVKEDLQRILTASSSSEVR